MRILLSAALALILMGAATTSRADEHVLLSPDALNFKAGAPFVVGLRSPENNLLAVSGIGPFRA